MAISGAPKPRVILLVGPTGVGKTKLALKLAGHFGGEIVSADSMQVYRGMDIGTAKPTPEERRCIPHHLIDVVDPDQPFDASRYCDLAHRVIARSAPGGKTDLCRRRHGALYPGFVRRADRRAGCG